MSERLLRAEDAADKLALTPRRLLADARAGRIPHVRIGRSVRFREESIDRWVRDLSAAPAHRRTDDE